MTLAGPGTAPAEALELRRIGVTVRERFDPDSEPGEHDEAFLDVWTPEVAPRVARLRAAGCRVRCLADLLLERSLEPVIGVTGTAGKTTTAAFLVQILRSAGRPVRAGKTARAGNLWPTAELLRPRSDGLLVMELTSSHLCFTSRSPTVAVITCFWPDHVELHGSFERYRAAKETIVRHQGADDVVVVNEDDPAAVEIAALSLGRRVGFSVADEVAEGAFLRGGALVLRDEGGERSLRLPGALDRPRLQALLAAAAAALAVGAAPEALPSLRAPAFRSARVGRLGLTELVDDGMAATPAKTAAALRPHASRSIVLVAGGELESAGLAVHASPEEHALLARACAEARRVTRLVVLFGPAAETAGAAARSSPDARRKLPRRGDRRSSPSGRGRRDAARLADVPALARGAEADRPRARGGCANREYRLTLPRYLW